MRPRGNSAVSRLQPSLTKIRKAIQIKTGKDPAIVVQQRKSETADTSDRNYVSVGKNAPAHVKNNKTLEINRSEFSSAADKTFQQAAAEYRARDQKAQRNANGKKGGQAESQQFDDQ